MSTLSIKNFRVSVEDKQILKGVDLTVKPGEIHAVMGPNGSGKSTLAYALAGHPFYAVTGGSVNLNNKDLLDMSPDERAQAGLFLAFQYPVAIEGVSVQNFLKTAYESIHGNNFPVLSKVSNAKIQMPNESIINKKFPILEFRKQLQVYAKTLGIPEDMLARSLNDGFSGGEKKRVEVLQMLTLAPKFAILDETDSGLDIDSIKLAAKGINQAIKQWNTGCLVITHYQRILKYLKPTHVHVMIDGKIAKSGGVELVMELEKSGYKQWSKGSIPSAESTK